VKDVIDLCPGTPAGVPVDPDGCSALQLNAADSGGGGGGGGGGGCALGRTGGFDPLLPLLLLFSALAPIVSRRPAVR